MENRVRIGGRDNYIDLEVLEVYPEDSQGAGDFRMSVSISSCGFTGHYDSVWILKDKFQEFLSQLKEVEEIRKGSARLDAMSPDEFQLVFHAVGPLGAIIVSGFLKRGFFHEDPPLPHSLEFAVEHDRDAFGTLVSSLASIAQGP